MQVAVTIEEEEGVSPPRVSPPRYLHQAVRISAVFEKGSNKQTKTLFSVFIHPKLKKMNYLSKQKSFSFFQEGG